MEEHELRKEKIQEDYNDKYWDQRYTVLPQQIPSFLQKVAGKILSTGDYAWTALQGGQWPLHAVSWDPWVITAFQALCP